MNYISIHFTTKETGFDTRKKAALLAIKNQFGPNVTLLHAFADKDFLRKMSMSTDVVDFLENHFPNQMPFFDGGKGEPMRKAMFNILKYHNGIAIFIDKIIEGVDKELDLATEVGVEVCYVESNHIEKIGDLFKDVIR